MLRFLLLCFAVLFLNGCPFSSFVQQNGYPDAGIRLWNDVKVGEPKSEVIKLLGSPVIIENGVWLYPSCRMYGVAASIIRKYSCTVLKVSFDDYGLVSNVERFEVPMRRLTKSKGAGTPITGVNDGAWRKIEGFFDRFLLR
ncbi:MAG: outer membrane protein assembly factor BamE [Anaplasma sp.]